MQCQCKACTAPTQSQHTASTISEQAQCCMHQHNNHGMLMLYSETCAACPDQRSRNASAACVQHHYKNNNTCERVEYQSRYVKEASSTLAPKGGNLGYPSSSLDPLDQPSRLWASFAICPRPWMQHRRWVAALPNWASRSGQRGRWRRRGRGATRGHRHRGWTKWTQPTRWTQTTRKRSCGF